MARMEQAVRCSSLAYTIVRPGYLTNGPQTGVYRTRVELTPSGGWRVSRADLADYMLKALIDPALVGMTMSITY